MFGILLPDFALLLFYRLLFSPEIDSRRIGLGVPKKKQGKEVPAAGYHRPERGVNSTEAQERPYMYTECHVSCSSSEFHMFYGL